jgi:hypothetical protein
MTVISKIGYLANLTHRYHAKNKPETADINVKFKSSPPRTSHLEVRSVQGHSHQQSRDQTCAWQGDDPGREDEKNLLPVDSANIKVAKRNTDGSSSQALSCGDRETKTTSQENGDGSTELHGESTGGRDLGNLVSKGAHDVEAEDWAMMLVGFMSV